MTRMHGETAEDYAKAMTRLQAIHRRHLVRMWPRRHEPRMRACVRANLRGQRSAKSSA